MCDVSAQHSIRSFSGLRNLFTRHNGLKIGCLNIRGLLNKIDEMRTIVTECNFDIMGICETFLDDNVADNEICIEGYTTVKKNRNRHGGGVMLYIKEGIQYNEITNLAGSEVESVWANIQCDKQQLALGIMYRPPSSNHAYLKSMLDQIDNVYSYNENVMLMGDLNYDYKLDESLSSNPLHQIEILYGMRQLINSPTRVTLTTSTIIDVMFSTEHESHVVTGVYDISLSDHYMTYTIYSKISHKTCLHKEINFRNYKRFNIDSFRNALSQNDNICNTSWSADQLADKWKKFKDGFIKISNNCAPMETRRLKHRNNPWINSHIIELIYERDYLKRKAIQYKNEETWLLYKRARNNVTEMIKLSKKQYYENSIQESRNNPTKMWKVLKQLTHGNNRESPPNTLTADIFNSYFTNIGLDTVSHLQPTPTTGVDGGENDLFWRGSNSTCCFDFTTIEQDSVKKPPS